jgi:hypothetical protein
MLAIARIAGPEAVMLSIDRPDRRIARPSAAAASRRPCLLAAGALLALITMAHAQTGSISGVVRLTNCKARVSDVAIKAGAKAVSPERDANSPSVLRYRISGLAKGRHQVIPLLPSGTCEGGAWNPASRTVRLNAGQSIGGQDFEYRGALHSKRISWAVLASLIEQVFRGTTLHLNNYGPRHQQTWHKADDSFIRLGADVGGSELHFDVPEVVGAAGRRYYLNDLNLSRLAVSPERDAVRLLLELESRGAAVKGRCTDDFTCFGAVDDAAPDFEIDNGWLELRLVPAANAGGTLTYGPVRAGFFITVESRGVSELADGLVEQQVRAAVEAGARRALAQASLRDRVAAALRPTLEAMQIATVAGAHMDGEDLVVEYPAQ